MNEGKTCDNCRVRPATVTWAPNGVIGYAHGLYSRWCRLCVLRAQVKHQRQMAALLPETEQELACELLLAGETE